MMQLEFLCSGISNPGFSVLVLMLVTPLLYAKFCRRRTQRLRYAVMLKIKEHLFIRIFSVEHMVYITSDLKMRLNYIYATSQEVYLAIRNFRKSVQSYFKLLNGLYFSSMAVTVLFIRVAKFVFSGLKYLSVSRK